MVWIPWDQQGWNLPLCARPRALSHSPVRAFALCDYLHPWLQGEAGAGAQQDDAVHRFQAHNELSLPERLWGRCREQPVSSLLIERGNKVAAREMLMVLPKIILCY